MIRKFDNLPFLKIKTNSRREMYCKRPHSHNEVSLGYIDSGRTMITVQGQKYLLTPGDLVLIPSRTVHICVPEDLSIYKFRMFYFAEDWWSAHFPVSPDSFKTLAFPATGTFRGIIEKICSDDPAEEVIESELITSVGGVLDRYEIRDIRSHPDESEIETIHQLIQKMPQASLTIDTLASQTGFNKYSLIRKYAGRYGLTPHADIVNMRIQRAILLFETDMELTDIALSCGFSDQSHFIHQFKLYCGLKPQEYRNGIRRISVVSHPH